jgi:ribosome maturation factor RimP
MKQDKQADINSLGGQKKVPQAKEKQIVAQVWAVAEPLCIEDGSELVFVQYRRESQGRVLRLYIDRKGGVTLDDCARISRQLGDILDIAIEDMGSYSLEVSSPGADRPLGRAEDFERFKGNTAHIKTRQPINGRKNFKGILYGFENSSVMLLCDNKKVNIALGNISIARLVNFNGESKCL